jgi:hypothetical protein
VKKDESRGSRIPNDVDLYNVVAVLPGTINKDERIIISGHYDTVNLGRPGGGPPNAPGDAAPAGGAAGGPPQPPRDPNIDAPGVTDDGSGTACVMELARVLSQYQFEKTLVFVTFAGEEMGLVGSTLYAKKAHDTGMKIEAVLNNDIIGSDVAGNGQSATNVLRLFAAPPEDSPARELGRYVKQIGERMVPSMQIHMVFRGDRFLRGGDHKPFVNQGYAAVRLTSASENYENQHTTTDTFANTSVPYAARVARINGAALASLALAPAPPVLNWIWNSGPNKGGHIPLLTRGKSGYDAVLHWLPNTEPDLAGYSVVIRATTSPVWEREVWVGNVTTYAMPDVSIDDIAIGVKAVDKDGNASLVSPYMEPVLPAGMTPATAK